MSDPIQPSLSPNRPISQPCPHVWKAIKPVLPLVTSSQTPVEPSQPITRKEEQRRAKLIQNHSQLAKPTENVIKSTLESPFFKDKNPRKLASVIGHIHGDQIIENSPLETLPPHVGAQILQGYLEACDTKTVQRETLLEVMSQFKQTAETINALEKRSWASPELHACAAQLMQQVYQLPPGKSYIIGGQASGGNRLAHSVLFEFHKNSDGTYDLFVYIMDKHKSGYDTVLHKDRRDWVRPFMHYHNLPAEKLFFNGPKRPDPQPDLFQTIVETRGVDQQFPPEHAASKLLSYLHAYRVPGNQELSGFMSAPRSHPDAWHSLKGVAFRYLGKAYKPFALEMKFRSLIEGYQLGQGQLQEDTIEGSELRTIMKHGADNLLRRLAVYRQSKSISEERCAQIEATCLDLQEQMSRIESEVIQTRRATITNLKYGATQHTKQKQEALRAAKATILPPKEEKVEIGTAQPQTPKLWEPQNFTSSLSAFLSKGVESADIEHLAAQFPIPKSSSVADPYWSHLPQNELPQSVEGLQTLLQTYDLKLRQRDQNKIIAISPLEANTVYTLYVILHFIALRIDREKNTQPEGHNSRLDSHPIYFPAVLYDLDPYHIYTSPQDFDKRQALKHYMTSTRVAKGRELGEIHSTSWHCSNDGYKEHTLGFYAALIDVHQGLSRFKNESHPFEGFGDLIPHLSPYHEDAKAPATWLTKEIEAGNAFKNAGLGYIPALFYASFLAYQFSGYTHLRSPPSERLDIIPKKYKDRFGNLSFFSLDFEVGCTLNTYNKKYESNRDSQKFSNYAGYNETSTQNLNPISNRLHPHIKDNFLDFPKRPLALRQPKRYANLDHKEGDVLKLKADHTELLRSCCEPLLQPHQMLYYYRSRFDLLSYPQEQTLFEIEFFRSVVGQAESFPLKEELAQKGFVQECRSFIQEGITRYFHLQLGGRPHVFATLFFLRLATRLSRFTREPLYHTLPYLEKMLDQSDLTPEEKSALCLHKILAYSIEKKEFTDIETKDLFRAWVYTKNTPLPASWKSALLEKEAATYLHAQLAFHISLLNDPSHKREILNETLRILEMPPITDDFIIEETPLPKISAHGKNGECWEMNLFTGKVCNQLGQLVRGAHPKWMPREERGNLSADALHFRYLFGNRVHCYSQTGTTIYFEDPVLGSMRVINEDIQKGLQRHMDGQWAQYVPTKTIAKKQIPGSLLADHTHWVPIDPTLQFLWICDFKTGEPKAQLTQKGEIHPILDEARTFELDSEQNACKRMDNPDFILGLKKGEELEKIAFTRFQSLSKEPLYFEMEQGEAIYGLNKKYALSPEQKEGLLGGSQQYLLLKHRESAREKILIPCRELSSMNPLTQHHTISTSTPDGYTSSQKGIYTFLEFDIKGDQLIPLSVEGTLYLAYLKLAQREYLVARELLDKIDFRQSLSPLSTKVLIDLIQICEGVPRSDFTEPGKDHSPAAAAVVLAAYSLLARVHDRMGTKNPCPFPKHAHRIYERNRESIPAGLELIAEADPKDDEYYTHTPIVATDQGVQPLVLKLPYPDKGLCEKYTYGDPEYANYSYAQACTKFIREKGEKIATHLILSTPYGKGYTNQNFFRTAYEIARLGTPEEREQLAFRLHVMEQLRDPNTLDYPSNAWLILRFAVEHPEKLPELPPEDNVLQAWGLLTTLQNLIREAKSPSQTPKSAIEIQDPPGPTPLLKEILPTQKTVTQVKEPSLDIPSKEEIDAGFIGELFQTHLKPVPRAEKKVEEIAFAYDPAWARSEDEIWAKKPIQEEFNHFQTDYTVGRASNQERVIYEGLDIPGLHNALQERSNALAGDLHNLEATIVEMANKMDPRRRAERRLLRESKIENELTIKKLIGLFLTGDRDAFKKANPYLAHPKYREKVAKALGKEDSEYVVIDYLYNQIGLYLTTGVYGQRLKRPLGHCKDIANHPDMDPLEKEDLIQKIALELNPKRLSPYDVKCNRVFLVYEYLSGLAIRPEQAEHLRKMLELNPTSRKYRNTVAQLIMGGGKTTLIGVILLKLAALEGSLSMFITPAAQYSSVGHNLRQSQKEYFDQEMEEIDFSGDQIYAKAEEIERRIQDTLKTGNFLIVKSETLLCLHLKFLTACFEAQEGKSDKLHAINTLRRILRVLRASGEALIDEVDLVLNILQEMNVPMGEEQHVDPSRIQIIRELFSVLISEEAATGPDSTANLRKLIALESNGQTLLKEEDLKGVVALAVAWKLIKKYPSIQDHFLSFYRYISGKMNTTCQKMLDLPDSSEYATWEGSLSDQDKQDFEFLAILRKMRHSKNQELEEAVHQIAVIKLMMRTVLPTTFQKLGNRHYGRGVEKPGEVRPFLASDVPSTNHFGYIYEWIAHHFQTVLQCGIKAPQLKALADLYREGAEGSLKANRLVWDEASGQMMPPEAFEFKQITGVDLDLIDKPGVLEQAVENIKSKSEELLKLEAETASSHVVYHPFRATANGMTLVNTVNARVMSATPHNAHCFEDCIADGYTPEWGIEGSIADLALERIQTEEKTHVHITTKRDLSLVKTLLKKHPEKQRIGMFMDSGALLKDYTNLEVAKVLRKQLGKAILFFMRDPNKDELTPDTLALLPLDSDQPRIIGGTSLEEIEKTGLNLGEYCVYADERHTTGTNLRLPFDAIGMMTIDETMLRRSFFQTMLRLREFFGGQRVEYVIPQEILPTLPPSSAGHAQLKTLLAALMGSIRNQAICKGKHYFRSRKQKIDSLFEQTLLRDHLLIDRDLTLDDLSKIAPFKKVMLTPQQDLPYDQFGALEYAVDAISDLKRHGNARIATFRAGGGDEESIQKFEKEIQEVITKAAESPWIIAQVPSPGVNELGMEVDILNEVNNQVEKNVEQEIDTELLKELQMYLSASTTYLRNDTVWADADIEALLTSLLTGSPLPPELQKKEGITPLKLQQLFDQKHYTYGQDFSTVFDDRIEVTKTWAFTTEKPLPVFHSLQRPAEQVLLFKTAKGYRALLLAQSEAGRFKKFLHEQYAQGKWKEVWLLLPDMSPYEDNPFAPPPCDEITDLFVQINVLNGNINDLENHAAETQGWLLGTGLSERKRNFLKLRVGNDPVKKKQYFESKLFGSTQGAKRQIYSSRIREKIASMQKADIEKLGAEDKELLRQLTDPKQLRMITPKQVPYLAPYQIKDLRSKPLIQAIDSQHKHAITREQFADLTDSQVKWFEQDPVKTTWFSYTRIPAMTERQREHLSRGQVEAIDTLEITQLLPPQARSHLTVEHVRNGLVPTSFIPDLRDSDAIKILPLEQLHNVNQQECGSTLRDIVSHLPLKSLEHVDVSLRNLYLTQDQVRRLKPGLHDTLLNSLTATQQQWLPKLSGQPVAKMQPKPHATVQAAPAQTIVTKIIEAAQPAPQLVKPIETLEPMIVPEPQQIEVPKPTIIQPRIEMPEEPIIVPEPVQIEIPKPTIIQPRIDEPLVEEESVQEEISLITEASPQWVKCKTITAIACFALGAIAFIGATILGICSIIGMHASWAPKLLVDLSHHLGPAYVSYILTAAGPAYLFCAWIGRCIQNRAAAGPTIIRA